MIPLQPLACPEEVTVPPANGRTGEPRTVHPGGERARDALTATATVPDEVPSTSEGDSRAFRSDSLRSAMLVMLLLTVVQRGTGFMRNVLVCRFLDPTELGAWNLANSFLIFAAPLLVLGIPGTFKRYVAYYQQRGQLRAFLLRTARVTTALTLGGALLMLLLPHHVAWFAFGDAASTRLVAFTAATLVVVISFNFCIELLTALRQVRMVSYLQLMNSIVFTVVSVVLITAAGLAAEGVILGFAVACFVSALLAARSIGRGLREQAAESGPVHASEIPLWQHLIPAAFWFWLADLLANLFGMTDRLMIVHFAGNATDASLAMIGQYHSSQIIGSLLIALTSMLAGILLSYVSHDWETGERVKAERTLDRSLGLISLSLTWCAALGLLISPVVFGWALDNKYAEGLRVLPLTMSYCIWCGLWTVAHNYLWCRERSWLVSVTVLVGLLLNVALNVWWLPRWGLAGAVMATAVANAATLAMVMGLCRYLGMRYRAVTWFAMLAPAVLLAGGATSLAVVTVWLVAGVWTGHWVDGCQRARWVAGLGRFGFRLTRDATT